MAAPARGIIYMVVNSSHAAKRLQNQGQLNKWPLSGTGITLLNGVDGREGDVPESRHSDLRPAV
jgi:hypothetical protein